MNNLEYDHADIFADLAAIQKQFHHLVRTVPSSGLLMVPSHDPALNQVLAQGCWTPVQHIQLIEHESIEYSGDTYAPWCVRMLSADGRQCEIIKHGPAHSSIRAMIGWSLTGRHNAINALAAIAAAHHVGVAVETACEALSQFASVKRRMEWLGEVGGIHVYDDFAHHPTAITTTLHGMRQRLTEYPDARLIAVIEPRSATMKMGVHQASLAASCVDADQVVWMAGGGNGLDIKSVIKDSAITAVGFNSVAEIVQWLLANCRAGDHIVLMSNGGFGGIHQLLLTALKARLL